MERVKIAVDFNELMDENTVMLSQTDTRADSRGKQVTLYEGMPVRVFEEDVYADGTVDYLVADGTAILHDWAAYPFFPHVKWFCRFDENGVQNRPELRAENAEKNTDGLPENILHQAEGCDKI